MPLVEHYGPGRVNLRNGGDVEVADEDVEEGAEVLDPWQAGSEVVAGGYGVEIFHIRL